MRPSLSLQKNNDKTRFNLTARLESGQLNNSLKDSATVSQNVFYFTPRASLEYEYKKGRRVGIHYESGINNPSSNQLLPVVDNTNPLELTYGNQYLKPEYYHDLRLNWILFDQFSFTSVFFGIGGTYTKDKINFSRMVSDNLKQTLSLVNVNNDYRADANIEFSTPVRPLKINTSINVDERLNRGISFVNNVQNVNTNLTHELTLSINNRKKNKWDVNVGGTIQYTQATYSLETSLNNNYYNLSEFTEINFSPSDKWHFLAAADITKYNGQNNFGTISIPMLRGEMSYYFLKSNRGVLTLEVFDILNKNTGIQRISELNYLEQRQSNTIGRYMMITFKYRLNKFDDKGGGVDIRVNGKR
jgi:hypothetical protein